jgi:hypothetical protein
MGTQTEQLHGSTGNDQFVIVTVTVGRLALPAKVVMPGTLTGALLEAFFNDPFQVPFSLSTVSQDAILEAGWHRPALSGKRVSLCTVNCSQRL